MRWGHAWMMVTWAAAAVGCQEPKPAENVPHAEIAIASAPDAGTRAAATEPPADEAAPRTDPLPGDTIVVGHVGPLTGNEASFGQSSDNGIKLAVEVQNRKNGIKGKKLVLRTYDDQGKPEEAVLAITRLIAADHASLVFGEVASSRSMAMAPVADSNHVPMVTHASTNPKVTQDANGKTRPYVFRTCFPDPFQGAVMAKYAREQLKLSKVAVFHDAGNVYTVGLNQSFITQFTALGGRVVAEQKFHAGDQDYKAQLTDVKAKGAEAIYVPGYYMDVALMARQARALGMKQPLLGGDGWESVKLFEIAKGALDGSFFTSHYAPEGPAPRVQSFMNEYKAAYASMPDALAALAFESAEIAFDAMSRANDLSGPGIRDALEKTKDFSGVTGKVTIDAKHDAIKSAVVIGIAKNQPKYAATVEP